MASLRLLQSLGLGSIPGRCIKRRCGGKTSKTKAAQGQRWSMQNELERGYHYSVIISLFSDSLNGVRGYRTTTYLGSRRAAFNSPVPHFNEDVAQLG